MKRRLANWQIALIGVSGGLACTLALVAVVLLAQLPIDLPEPEPKAGPVAQEELNTLRQAAVPAQEYVVAEPLVHDNLAIYLVRGRDTLRGPTPLTLQEALDQNLAVVHETGFANLSIENRSEAPLFIQSGDIVKGGQQDRVLRHDQVIPSGSGRVPVAAFCVEQGRSGPRGLESVAAFSLSAEQLPGKQLRLAAQYRESQDDVWNGVRQMQGNLARNANGPVLSEVSHSSLQLTLENGRVQASIRGYLEALSPALEGKADVIGYAVVVNGRLHSADVYASAALFRKAWPKLLRANAVAALAERQPELKGTPPTAAELKRVLVAAERGPASRRATTGQMDLIVQETPEAVLFDACDRASGGVVIHRSLLAR